MILTREPETFPASPGIIARMGRWLLLSSREIGRASMLLVEAVLAMRLVLHRRPRNQVVEQMYSYGIKSLSVVTIVAIFTGMIMALQAGIELRKFNQEVNIGTAVMVTMLREMGPFMTGLIMSACVGSSMAALLGTMTVSEEIAAMEIMSISPVKYLVMPRLLAMVLIMPALSFYTCIMGVLGGGVVGMTQLDVSWMNYIDNATRYADNKDLFVGLFKAVLFGMIITAVSCHEGFRASQGAVGVGRATRKSVIESFLLILIVGYFVTRLFYV
jgi:phospholipid/cholesterol/gamma-HCH transport system permease protein